MDSAIPAPEPLTASHTPDTDWDRTTARQLPLKALSFKTLGGNIVEYMNKTLLTLTALATLTIATDSANAYTETDLHTPDSARQYMLDYYNYVGTPDITVVACSLLNQELSAY